MRDKRISNNLRPYVIVDKHHPNAPYWLDFKVGCQSFNLHIGSKGECQWVRRMFLIALSNMVKTAPKTKRKSR